MFLRAIGPTAVAATAFGVGGSWILRPSKCMDTETNELHEFHVRGRLNGRRPARALACGGGEALRAGGAVKRALVTGASGFIGATSSEC